MNDEIMSAIFFILFLHIMISGLILGEFETHYIAGVSTKYKIICFIPIVNLIVWIYFKIKYDI